MGMPAEATPPSLSWSVPSRINELNAWKNRRRALSTENEDGTRGLAWRTEVSAGVFECASIDAARRAVGRPARGHQFTAATGG